MDTSKEYIKMCEKFKEGHYLWVPEAGDFYYDYRGDAIWVYQPLYEEADRVIEEFGKTIDDEFCFPLFRQDQLQVMVINAFGVQDLVKRISDFANEVYTFFPHTLNSHMFNSMEQLWLAFVQSELHQKYWDGSDWIKKCGRQFINCQDRNIKSFIRKLLEEEQAPAVLFRMKIENQVKSQCADELAGALKSWNQQDIGQPAADKLDGFIKKWRTK